MSNKQDGTWFRGEPDKKGFYALRNVGVPESVTVVFMDVRDGKKGYFFIGQQNAFGFSSKVFGLSEMKFLDLYD